MIVIACISIKTLSWNLYEYILAKIDKQTLEQIQGDRTTVDVMTKCPLFLIFQILCVIDWTVFP